MKNINRTFNYRISGFSQRLFNNQQQSNQFHQTFQIYQPIQTDEPQQKVACTVPTNVTSTNINTNTNENIGIIVKRGNCAFGEKGKNIEQAGAQLAIVINNQPNNVVLGMIGAQTVNIPTIMVGNEDGKFILDLLDDGEQVFITLTGSGPCIKTEADAIRNIIAASTWEDRPNYYMVVYLIILIYYLILY
jgi:hypothetical protein